MSTKKWIEDNQDRLKQYRREYYYRNRDSEKLRIRNRSKELAEFLRDYKQSGIKCERCGEKHPATLQFHHKDPRTKIMEVSKMIASGYSKENIMGEIAKCEVLCANCHAKEHYKHLTAYDMQQVSKTS